MSGKIRTCRVCGCTDDESCLFGDLFECCHWVSDSLCSNPVCASVGETGRVTKSLKQQALKAGRREHAHILRFAKSEPEKGGER